MAESSDTSPFSSLPSSHGSYPRSPLPRETSVGGAAAHWPCPPLARLRNGAAFVAGAASPPRYSWFLCSTRTQWHPFAPFASCRLPAEARPSLSCLLLLLRFPLCSSSDLCCRLMDSFHLYKESQVLTLNLHSHLSIYYSLLHISIYLFVSLHWEHLCNFDLQSCSSFSWQYTLFLH